jgi:hypothetical protein
LGRIIQLDLSLFLYLVQLTLLDQLQKEQAHTKSEGKLFIIKKLRPNSTGNITGNFARPSTSSLVAWEQNYLSRIIKYLFCF